MQSLFTQLDKSLQSHQALWRFEPFHQSALALLPWLDSHPELCHWLSSLSVEEIRRYKSNRSLLFKEISSVFPDAEYLQAMSILQVTETNRLHLDKGIDKGIPGRKFAQIESMGSFVLDRHEGNEWLEWCSGKGYLGRILASQSQQLVTSFEWQESLCNAGQLEADEKTLPMRFIQGDALSEDSKKVIKKDQHAVALHACGDLHVRLIQQASQAGSAAISISPCCYHLIENNSYQALSALAQQSRLELSKAELRIPLQETVTGGKRVTRHREEEMRFRLAFDLILREVLNMEDYIPIPSLKKSMLSQGFEYFCNWAAEMKGLILPELDYEYWEQRGESRFWKMERLSLVQLLFRRPLELWLVLDRGLYLQQCGYQVSVTEFCDRDVTPRNIIIHAVKTEN